MENDIASALYPGLQLWTTWPLVLPTQNLVLKSETLTPSSYPWHQDISCQMLIVRFSEIVRADLRLFLIRGTYSTPCINFAMCLYQFMPSFFRSRKASLLAKRHERSKLSPFRQSKRWSICALKVRCLDLMLSKSSEGSSHSNCSTLNIRLCFPEIASVSKIVSVLSSHCTLQLATVNPQLS